MARELVISENKADSAVRGAVFDMDGLMFDTEKLFLRFWREASAFYGYNMTVEHVLNIRSLSRKYSVPLLKSLFGEDFPFDKIRKRRIEIMDKYIDENGFEVKKGLFTLLDYLGEHGIKRAVATATRRERTLDLLEKVGISSCFESVICGDMIENGKPEPDIYITACRELGLQPCECTAFEDSPNGIKSAYTAGCQVIMIPDLTQPDSEIIPMLSGVYKDLGESVNYFRERCPS